MFWFAAFLTALWLLGLVTGYTLGSFIHVLLVLALILVLIKIDNLDAEAPGIKSQMEE